MSTKGTENSSRRLAACCRLDLQVFTGAISAAIHGSRSQRFPRQLLLRCSTSCIPGSRTDCDTSTIHGSRKTWKVCRSDSFPHHAGSYCRRLHGCRPSLYSGFGQKLKIYIPAVGYASRTMIGFKTPKVRDAYPTMLVLTLCPSQCRPRNTHRASVSLSARKVGWAFSAYVLTTS
jgi:hypothetical protein